MGVIYLLIGASITIAAVFLSFFFWASKSGQFDDDYTPSIRMLFDEEEPSDNPLND